MNIPNLTALKLIALLLALLPTQKAVEQSQQPEKNGTIVVLVTWGDDDNTPADDVYIEAHGFVR